MSQVTMKRKRSPNFTVEEKGILISILEREAVYCVVENAKTDGVSQKEKGAMWENISRMFNSQGGNFHRSPENIKGMWENLKKNAKRVLASARQQRILTGETISFHKI